jgi:hypothetical protein
LAGGCRARGEEGRSGWEESASEGQGAGARSKRPMRFSSGKSMMQSMASVSALSSSRSCSSILYSDFVGELAVEIDIALEESEIDSSLILVLRGTRTWC